VLTCLITGHIFPPAQSCLPAPLATALHPSFPSPGQTPPLVKRIAISSRRRDSTFRLPSRHRRYFIHLAPHSHKFDNVTTTFSITATSTFSRCDAGNLPAFNRHPPWPTEPLCRPFIRLLHPPEASHTSSDSTTHNTTMPASLDSSRPMLKDVCTCHSSHNVTSC
jgi:hypothetical protein